jgi:hypothetical protein
VLLVLTKAFFQMNWQKLGGAGWLPSSSTKKAHAADKR